MRCARQHDKLAVLDALVREGARALPIHFDPVWTRRRFNLTRLDP